MHRSSSGPALRCLQLRRKGTAWACGALDFTPMRVIFLLADVVARICRFFPSHGEFFKLALMKGF